MCLITTSTILNIITSFFPVKIRIPTALLIKKSNVPRLLKKPLQKKYKLNMYVARYAHTFILLVLKVIKIMLMHQKYWSAIKQSDTFLRYDNDFFFVSSGFTVETMIMGSICKVAVLPQHSLFAVKWAGYRLSSSIFMPLCKALLFFLVRCIFSYC